MSKHIGSKFDDFLDKEGLLAEAEAVATKRVIAFQVRELMKKQKLTKVQLAKRMKTSRSALERLHRSLTIPVRRTRPRTVSRRGPRNNAQR